ncbi:MAG: hypothetical protein SNJ57_09490 [Cyanobacteriota bacterium]
MASITIRDIPDDAIARIDEMLDGKKSREAYLRELIVSASEAPAPIKLRWGQGLKAISPNGGDGVLRNLETTVSGGFNSLTQAEANAFSLAKIQADPRNGADWAKAKATLESAGFEVYWV